MVDKMCDIFSKKINAIDGEKFIIGVGFCGLILAPIIAYNTQSPFTYIVQKHLENKFVLHEKDFCVNENSKIIIVTDIIVTYKTIDDAITLIKKKSSCKDENIENILAILYRNSSDISLKSLNIKYANNIKKFQDKTFVLNNELDIEICRKQKEKCIFLKNNIELYNM